MQHDLQTRQSPREAGLVSNIKRLGGRMDYAVLAGQPSSRPLDALLSRLGNVRQHGKGYRCDCPNGHASRGALSIAEGDDGRVLIRCFAGCEAVDVLAALGMTLADLYPAPVRDMTPLGRAQRREAMQAASVVAAVAVLAREADVVSAAAGTLAHGDALDDADRGRLALAASRIHDIKAVLHG